MKSLLILLVLTLSYVRAQDGLLLDQNTKKETISFQLINNLIFIPITVNGVELTFLLDTGVAETLLFSVGDSELVLQDTERVKFSGLGGAVEIEGLKSVNNKVQIGSTFADSNHTIFVILDEEFNFSSHVGIPVNGIIGYPFFRNHQVKIDYQAKKITVYRKHSNYKIPRKSFAELDITIESNKPYVMAGVEQVAFRQDSKLLLDLGNSDPLWLFPEVIDGFQYNRPNIDDFLGRGFNGDIYGKRSRIHRLYLDRFTFEKPLAAHPDAESVRHLTLVPGRKGSIGNDLLRRFTLIFDYPMNKLYLKKNRFYYDPFHLNMSGLEVKHDGMTWSQELVKVENPSPRHSETAGGYAAATNEFRYKFTLKPEYSVAGIRAGSPASLAGLRKGDKLMKLNNRNTAEMKLDHIMQLLKSEPGKKITVEIIREDKFQKFTFFLEDPVPYTDIQ
ncbi:aspartyl protease family protein [Kaistella sp. PBT33-4]|uniref:retropepsin-like aspartic protease n=1 Tax=Kaistella sp. PBT33-4 TaxID=3032000 RepID=UPI0023D7E517|nr:PDZ domain-containing protein [Kaistella sp. PBT33-4]MDF0719905.1 aspartyl protease family protein [Kaistella sp. PBT33-4]